MIVISKHTNQLCNRLFTYLPVLSYALEAGEPVRFLFQYKGYDRMFPNLHRAGMTSHLQDKTLSPSIGSKLLNAVVRFLNRFVHMVMQPGEKIPLHKPLGVLFNPKWKEIRYDRGYISRHADTLRHLFTPGDEVWTAIGEMMPAAPEECVTVGVHMRGGDYRTYLGGRYFYTTEVYRKFMLQMKSLLEEKGKSVRFLICTNEAFRREEFEGLDIMHQQGTDMLVDLYGLSRCDYIIGPPSTFSQWASFYGGALLKPLMSADEHLSLDDFGRVVALDTFENQIND